MASLATALAAANRQSLALVVASSPAPLTLRVLMALEAASQRRKRWRTRWCGSRSTYESRRNSSNLEICGYNLLYRVKEIMDHSDTLGNG